MKNTVAFMTAILLISLTFFGCAPNITEKTPIIQLWTGSCMVGEDEFEKEQSEWILSQLIDEYNAAQDKVEVQLTYFDDADMLVQALKAADLSETDIPDIAVVQSGVYLKDISEIFAPLNGYVTDSFKEKSAYWETTTFDDIIYGYPTTGVNITYFAYNRDLVSTAGLDFDNNPPKTLAELVSDLETIKNAGIVPITAGDYELNDLFSTAIAKWWFQGSDLQTIQSDGYRFSTDTGFLEACEIAQDFWKSGYIVDDYITNQDTLGDLINGRAALYNTFIFELGILEESMGDNLGLFPVPDLSENCAEQGLNLGSCNQCMSILAKSTKKEESVAFIEWLLSKENSVRLYQEYKGMPIRTDVSLADLGWENDKYYAQILPLMDNICTYPDYLIIGANELADAYYKYGPMMVTCKITPIEYASYLDNAFGN